MCGAREQAGRTATRSGAGHAREFIPARAGWSETWGGVPFEERVHPRARGVVDKRGIVNREAVGSSPRVPSGLALARPLRREFPRPVDRLDTERCRWRCQHLLPLIEQLGSLAPTPSQHQVAPGHVNREEDALASELQLLLTHPDGSGRLPAVQQPVPLGVDKDEDQIPCTGKEAYRRLFTDRACPDCGGVQLNAAARAVELAGGETIGRLVECELTELDRMLADLVARDDYEPTRDVVTTLVARMRGTLRHLSDISVGYLSLNRGVPTLSGGESQRVKMARQLDCDLVDLIYILDEPTVGLHPRDIDHPCVRLTLFVQFVRIRNRTMSETISSGGLSSASEY